ATTVSAGIMNITGNYLPRHDLQGRLNVALTAIMLALAAVITVESVKSWLAALNAKRAAQRL
ncbi:MAG: hypothetical protein WC204_10800, partial [Elusimicrobiales bacterium]